MSMTFLQIVQAVCRSSGFPVPTSVVGSGDAAANQLLGLMGEELDDVTIRDNFGPLQRECVFTSVATELQGLMSTLLAGDTMWKYVVNSMFDRTSHLRVEGPVTEQEWQQYKALQAGMLPRFRFWQEGLYLQPAPPAGHTFGFEYLSQNCVVTAVTGVKKRYITADTDTFLIPDEVLKAALKWRYKCEKQLAYSEDFSRYERMRASLFLNAAPKKVLHLGDAPQQRQFGVIISPGSWPIS
jgi:hypothetical protein